MIPAAAKNVAPRRRPPRRVRKRRDLLAKSRVNVTANTLMMMQSRMMKKRRNHREENRANILNPKLCVAR